MTREQSSYRARMQRRQQRGVWLVIAALIMPLVLSVATALT